MSTYLEYRYPGEDWIRIESPYGQEILYTISYIAPLYRVRYFYSVAVCQFYGNVQLQTSGTAGQTRLCYGPIDGIFIETRLDSYSGAGSVGVVIYCKEITGADKKTGVWGGRPGSRLISGNSCPSRDSSQHVLSSQSLARIDELTLLEPIRYDFRVFYKDPNKTEPVPLFQRISPDSPEVKLGEQKCPPNTCAVDCGTHVCCYNSQGISVFNYLK